MAIHDDETTATAVQPSDAATATKKTKSKKKKAANGPKKTAKPKAAKKPKKEKAGAPREGSVARYIFDAIVAGKENEDIAKAASKKFGNQKINKSYVQWWRHRFEQTGLVKGAK